MRYFRRTLAAVALIACANLANAQQGNITLPQPKTQGGMPIMDALKNRESARDFKADELPLPVLSSLLWAANGYNRSNGKRTAPNSMNYQEVDTYVVLKGGIYKFNAKEVTLELVCKGDFRELTGKQAYVKEAPVNLIYVADFTRVPKGESEGQLNASYANCGFIAQNVYLFCASESLGCVVRAYFDQKVLSEAMKLLPTQQIILTQTVGYKK
jgi:nitroreductase